MSSTSLTRIESFSDAVMPLLASEYRNSPQLKGVIESANTLAQNLEQALFEIQDLLRIPTASGKQLDILGSIYGVERNGLLDADFREQIRIRARTGHSGTPEEIITLVRELTGATSVRIIFEFPASFMLLHDSETKLSPRALLSLSPAGVGVSVGTWLAHEDDDPEPYPLFIELEDDGDWILIEDYGTADIQPPEPEPVTLTFTVSEDPLVAGAEVNISADALVGISAATGGAILADAVLGIEAVGVAATSVSPGDPLTILQYGTTGPFGVPPAVGLDLYLGESGRWVTTPPAGAILSQRTGMSVPLTGGIGASINIQQPVWL